MAPILIDNRGLIKLGFISVLTTVIVFAAGFLSGYQQAITFYAAGSEIETLALPEQTVLLESEVEQQSPETIVAGAEIDVDQPHDDKASAKNRIVESKVYNSSNKEKVNQANDVSTSKKLSSREQPGKSTTKISNDDKNVLNKNNRFSIKASSESSIKEKLTSADFQHESGETAASKEHDFMVLASLTSAELINIKYSIQVGMYVRLTNAENMVKMLQAQHLDAYVSGYTSKKNENRYNVRFGYFVDKKSAIIALQNYKNKQKGDGYLVNFSVDNIVKLADAVDLKESSTTEKTKKKTSSESVPSGIIGDEVSQTDVATVLADAQSQAVVEILPDKRVSAIAK
jgi:cell division septation protein DedD